MNVYEKRIRKTLEVVKPHVAPYVLSTFFVSTRNYCINLLNALLFSSVAYAARLQDLPKLKEGIQRFILFLVAFILFDTLNTHMQSVTVEKMTARIREMTYRKFLESKPQNKFLQKENRGEVLSRLSNDVELIQSLFLSNILYAMMLLISGVGGSINIFLISPIIGFYLIFLGLAALLTKLYLSGKIFDNSKEKQKYFSEITAFLNQYVSQLQNIRMMNMVEPLTNWLLNRCKRLTVTIERQSDLDARLSSSSTVVDLAIYVGVSVWGIFAVKAGKLHVEQIVFVLQLAPMVTSLFLCLGDGMAALKKSLIGVDRLMEVWDLPSEEMGKPQQEDGDSFEAAFSAQNLSVRFENHGVIQYPTEISIPAGTMTAICGESGCGKSTLGKAFAGLIVDHQGSIQYSGKSINEYTLASLRKSVTYVPQPDYFIEGTILENLLLGNERQPSLEEIIQTGEKLGCIQWIWELPSNFNESIPYMGTSLSGGQKQSLSILRAVLMENQTVIFDETFSHLDARTVQSVMAGLRELGKTCIVITHDPNIIAGCTSVLDLSTEDEGNSE